MLGRPSIVDRTSSNSHRSSIDSQLFVQNRDFCLPHLHSKSPLEGSPLGYCLDVWYGKKLEWFGYPVIKIGLVVLTEHTNVTDGRQTDGQTDTAWRRRPRLHGIARQNGLKLSFNVYSRSAVILKVMLLNLPGGITLQWDGSNDDVCCAWHHLRDLFILLYHHYLLRWVWSFLKSDVFNNFFCSQPIFRVFHYVSLHYKPFLSFCHFFPFHCCIFFIIFHDITNNHQAYVQNSQNTDHFLLFCVSIIKIVCFWQTFGSVLG